MPVSGLAGREHPVKLQACRLRENLHLLKLGLFLPPAMCIRGRCQPPDAGKWSSFSGCWIFGASIRGRITGYPFKMSALGKNIGFPAVFGGMEERFG
jgi:hypothetical protein